MAGRRLAASWWTGGGWGPAATGVGSWRDRKRRTRAGLSRMGSMGGGPARLFAVGTAGGHCEAWPNRRRHAARRRRGCAHDASTGSKARRARSVGPLSPARGETPRGRRQVEWRLVHTSVQAEPPEPRTGRSARHLARAGRTHTGEPRDRAPAHRDGRCAAGRSASPARHGCARPHRVPGCPGSPSRPPQGAHGLRRSPR